MSRRGRADPRAQGYSFWNCRLHCEAIWPARIFHVRMELLFALMIAGVTSQEQSAQHPPSCAVRLLRLSGHQSPSLPQNLHHHHSAQERRPKKRPPGPSAPTFPTTVPQCTGIEAETAPHPPSCAIKWLRSPLHGRLPSCLPNAKACLTRNSVTARKM